MTESPIANQPSNCMKKPVRMSIRKRCSAKPMSTTTSDAPASAPLLPSPAIWISVTTTAIP